MCLDGSQHCAWYMLQKKNLAVQESIELKSILLILIPLNWQVSLTLTSKEEGFHFSLGIVSSPVLGCTSSEWNKR